MELLSLANADGFGGGYTGYWYAFYDIHLNRNRAMAISTPKCSSCFRHFNSARLRLALEIWVLITDDIITQYCINLFRKIEVKWNTYNITYRLKSLYDNESNNNFLKKFSFFRQHNFRPKRSKHSNGSLTFRYISCRTI